MIERALLHLGSGPFSFSLSLGWGPKMTEILVTGTSNINSKLKQARAAVIGLIVLIFYSRTINIFSNSFIKNLNPFIKNQLSIIWIGKKPVTKICY